MDRIAWAMTTAVLLAAAGRGLGEEPRLAGAVALQEAMTAAIKKAEPSVVCVLVARGETAQAQTLADLSQVPESYGSGVVLDEGGPGDGPLVLTNLHVVRDATAVYVRAAGGKGSPATIYAGDPRSDLAVLRLREPVPVRAVTFGDGGAVQKGDLVVSLAHPFAAGFRDGSPSASAGIVSNVRRRAPGKATREEDFKTLHQYGTLLQTDVRLNAGCSGGALIDLHGNLIGLTTALAAISGGETPGGFAVPMDAGMRRIIDVLRRGEEVEYGFLGVSFPRDHQAPASDGGVVINQVIPGSPAALAGLRAHDSIRSINGVKVREPDDLFLALGTLLAGTEAKLEVAHSARGPSETVTVKLSKFYVPGKVIATKRPEAIGGLRVDYTSILYLRPGGQQVYGARGIPEGVMIREVVSGSAADAARLQESKVIQRVNGRKVTTPDEFYREMRNANGSAELTLGDPRDDNKVKIDLR